MEFSQINPRRAYRSSSVFHSPAISEEDRTPLKFRRLRSRHSRAAEKAIRDSSDDIDSYAVPSRYSSLTIKKINPYIDEGSSTNDVFCNENPFGGWNSTDSQRAPYSSFEPAPISERNESLISFSSTNNRLLEDVELIKELIFLRDIQLGFLPDDYEVEFESCFERLSNDEKFAVSNFII